MVRINIIVAEDKRENFFTLCRRLKPKRLSMNSALNGVIDAILDGRISLSDLSTSDPETKTAGRKKQGSP